MGGDLTISSDNFIRTAYCFDESKGLPDMFFIEMPPAKLNPQTKKFCDTLGIDDPMSLLIGSNNLAQEVICSKQAGNPDEVSN